MTRRVPAFACAICGRSPDVRWARAYGPDALIPPLCRGCEMTWGKSVGTVGTFRDRRFAAQLSALAEALSDHSHQAHHRRHGYGPA